ncbi:hypothetical protein WDW86_20900 [Bdellovibrionota bacterium FG-2]
MRKRNGVALWLAATLAAFGGTSHALAESSKGFQAGATVAAGFPHPLTFSLNTKLNPTFGVDGTYGYFGLSLNNIKVSTSNFEARGRWHPFDGSFFLGAAVGRHSISASQTQDITIASSGVSVAIPTKVGASITALYVTPQIGWLIVFGSGFTLGWDLGAVIPVSPSTTIDVEVGDATLNSFLTMVKQTSDYAVVEKTVQDKGNEYGKFPLPYLTVLRLGWMF